MNNNIRIGIGFDIHRFKKSKKLVLGGVEIPFPYGLEAYSDGDVLLHAICDAMLGAAGKQDIGHFFPNNDPRYKGVLSSTLLKKTKSMIGKDGFRIINLDCVVICDEPKIAPYINSMKKKINNTLKIRGCSLAIKATTTEGVLSFSRKGIAAYCVVLLSR